MNKPASEHIKTLEWTWESPFENIVIIENSKKIGFIPSFKKNAKCFIYETRIQIERQGIFGQHIYFVDPTDNIAYCKYDTERICSSKRTSEIIDGILYDVTTINEKKKFTKSVELKVKRKIFDAFQNSGQLIIYNDKFIGIDIFSLFYDYNYKR